MKLFHIQALFLALMALSIPACEPKEGQSEGEHHKIVITSPKVEDLTLTQQYVCQIRSRRHIRVCAQANGYLDEILVNEGQEVKEGAEMFKIRPVLYNAKFEAEKAEANLAELELTFTKNLNQTSVVSKNEVALYQAKLAKANAKAQLAKAELDFTTVKAPFDGFVDRLEQQLGSLIKEGEQLTTLSDNSVMWVYFNVPEVRYLEYKARQGPNQNKSQLKLVDSRIQLVLANGTTFDQEGGDTVTVEANFNNETGNIPFRADFRNPDRLLRHGQTGNVLIHRTMKNAVVIPQRATFEILDKRYVFVVGEDEKVHQREIAVEQEMEDIFIIKSGLEANDRFVLDGVRQVRDGQPIEGYDVRTPEEALSNMKNPAQ